MIEFKASVEKRGNTFFNCYTTSMDELMDFLCKYEDDYQYVVENKTGKLLFRTNHPIKEDYIDEHFQLMCLGWMMMESEPTPDPRAELMKNILKVCQKFGIDLRTPI